MTRQRIFSINLFVILVFNWTLIPQVVAQDSASPQAYPFAIEPDRVISKLADLQVFSVKVSPDEMALFEDAKDGKFDEHSFAEALLIASGVTEKQKRHKYLGELDKLELRAREATQQSDKPIKQGELLLKFLHSGPMAGGYQSQQTDLHTILESGQFNCVSSATLYNVLANRLGLDVRGVEIPEHVFSIVDLGQKWVDVETTNALGFNPSRDPESQEEITKPGGTVYIPDKHRNLRREVDQAGLVAIVYYNHGVHLSDNKRQAEAMIASFSALCLDRANANAHKNVIAGFTNWPMDLCEQGKFEEALQVQSFGLELVPGDPGLVNNRKVVWQRYAQTVMDNGDAEQAVIVLQRAAAEMTGGDFILRQADLFIRQAQTHIANGNLNQALAICDRGLPMIDARAREQLREWKSAQVHNHVLRIVNEKTREGDYESALAAIASHIEQLGEERTVRSFQLQVYDSWANKDVQNKNWRAAIDIYNTALEQLPKDSHLTQNAVFVYDAWARDCMQEENWKEAIDVYEQALNRFPENSHLAGNLKYCQSRLEN